MTSLIMTADPLIACAVGCCNNTEIGLAKLVMSDYLRVVSQPITSTTERITCVNDT